MITDAFADPVADGEGRNSVWLAAQGLESLHLASHDDVVDEGPGHSGMSGLIDLLARRPA